MRKMKIMWVMLTISIGATAVVAFLLVPGFFQGYEPQSPGFEILALGFVTLVIIDGALLKFATGEKFTKLFF